MENERKKEIVKIGAKVAHIIETVCVPRLDGEAARFIRLYWHCQDWFDHPDWPEFEEKVTKCKEIMDSAAE